MANVEGRRTTRLLEEHGDIVKAAIDNVFDKKILERVGFADRADLVRIRSEAIPQAKTAPDPDVRPEEATPAGEAVVTTETELFVYDYVRGRLPFLIERDEELFQKLAFLKPMDYKTVFSVFYKQERKGKLFNFREGGTGPRYRFEFVALGPGHEVNTDTLADIDQPLLDAFLTRVRELG